MFFSAFVVLLSNRVDLAQVFQNCSNFPESLRAAQKTGFECEPKVRKLRSLRESPDESQNALLRRKSRREHPVSFAESRHERTCAFILKYEFL